MISAYSQKKVVLNDGASSIIGKTIHFFQKE